MRLGGILALAFAIIVGAPARAAESVLIFGGSGQLGAEIAKVLAARGDRVSVFVRKSSNLDRLKGLAVARIEGDVTNEDDVAAALKSAKFTVVVDALGRSGGAISIYEVSERHIAKWAKATGVRQVILHGSVGAGSSRKIYPKSRLAAMTPTLDAKEAGEKHLIASGVTYTIIRNAILRDPAPGAADCARLYEDDTKYGIVTRPALARLTAECIGNPACANKIFHAVDETIPIPDEMRER
jgi:uncharacterized protein YbjT (DUF2867 family)